MSGALESGREAFARRAWDAAYALLSSAQPVEADDLERLAVAAHLVGRDGESAQAWERAQLAHVALGDPGRAARCAFWLSFSLMLRGQSAQAGGWLARAERLAGEAGHDCATTGFVLIPEFMEALWSGALDTARALADRILALANRCHDRELLAFGLLCRGELLLSVGETRAGMKLLDEVMVAVTTGEVSPFPAGIVYCAVIEACVDAFDIRRAAEWTERLDEWCAEQPGLVHYRGQCLVHRSQVLQAGGAWGDAVSEAEQARRRLADAGHPAVADALYQLGELHRLRGEFADAERAYGDASRHGHEPVPGFALLRLAEGRVDAAVRAIGRMADETRGLRTHPHVLAAAVEVLLAAGDVGGARSACDELAKLTDAAGPPLRQAIVAYATGSVLLAEGDAASALVELRRAYAWWRELDMPYDAARARVQVAVACRALGDDDAADLELGAARAVFERLGAAPELARVAALDGAAQAGRAAGLTDRECEVLRVVATGMTNREVARTLSISEHTVARHLQNIFAKLGLSSRAAATTYAHAHGLV